MRIFLEMLVCLFFIMEWIGDLRKLALDNPKNYWIHLLDSIFDVLIMFVFMWLVGVL